MTIREGAPPWGSLSLPARLWQAGAVDVVRLVVVSVALGSGRSVFPAGSRTSGLRLIESETLGGVFALDYAVRSSERQPAASGAACRLSQLAAR